MKFTNSSSSKDSIPRTVFVDTNEDNKNNIIKKLLNEEGVLSSDDEIPKSKPNIINGTPNPKRNIKTSSTKKKSLKDVYYEEWKRATPKEATVPALLEQLETSSVDSLVHPTTSKIIKRARTWGQSLYKPQPLLDPSSIIWIGIIVFVIALIWPPLLLVVFFMASKGISFAFRENDDGGTRRQLFQQFIEQGYGSLPASFRKLVFNDDSTSSNDENDDEKNKAEPLVRYEDGYWTNARGMQLHTVMMTPTQQPITAVVCFCHGYTDNISFMKIVEYQRLVAKAGIAFVGIEYEGHGLSDGLMAYIDDWNLLIGDVTSYFTEVLQTEPHFQNKPAFLMGESMGGAVAYDVSNRIAHLFTGVILVCPMCKISDEMLPSPFVIDCLKRLLELFPWLGYLPLSPSKQNLDNVSYKLQSKFVDASLSPLNYSRPARLATARELIDATTRISESLVDYDVNFLVVHGKDDVVTDPALSQQLFEEAKSTDKSIRLYDSMWHAITCGESDTDIDIVFHDIITWIQQRIPNNDTPVVKEKTL